MWGSLAKASAITPATLAPVPTPRFSLTTRSTTTTTSRGNAGDTCSRSAVRRPDISNYLNAGNVGFLGQFSYNGIYSSNLNASDGPGYGPADFVLGRISNVQLASPLGNVGNRQWRIA